MFLYYLTTAKIKLFLKAAFMISYFYVAFQIIGKYLLFIN